MTPRERGFLLLTSRLGDPRRKPLSVAQFRTLTARVREMTPPEEERQMVPADLMALGYTEELAERILHLLSDQALLEYYLHKGHRCGCYPLTRVSEGYPAALRKTLGADSPGCLWAKGDRALLDTPCVALVGSRELREANRSFAWEVGMQAARQGYTLVSGNARGADKQAQQACLDAGGHVICIVADKLEMHTEKEGILYLSEDGFDEGFSPQRALSRNRLIHCLGRKTFVAQSGFNTGGSWDGTEKNLRFGWSSVYCFDDGSAASRELEQMGAVLITKAELSHIDALRERETGMFGII